jgi:hypothetical protein
VPAASGAPLVLRLVVDEASDPGDVPVIRDPARPAAADGGWAAPHYLADGPLFLIDLRGEGVATADLAHGSAAGRVSHALAADLPYLRHTVVEALGLSMLAGRGYIAVHAACLVVDGVGVVIQAPAGTGKSTLAYAAARRGIGVLAEDAVFARLAEDDGAELWGAPWRLHLLPDAPGLFPELRGLERRRQMNGEWKLEVDVAASFPSVAVPCAPAGPQVLLRRGTGPGLRHLDAGEALDAFTAIWPWGLPWSSDLEAVAAALRGQGVIELQVTGPPDAALDQLLDAVAGWRARRGP